MINTDEFNHQLKPILVEAFGEEDLVKFALEHPKEITRKLKKPWLELLKNKLEKAPIDSYVFVETAYGLCEDKRTYKYVGGNVLYIGCSRRILLERNEKRMTPNLKAFINVIPDSRESRKTAKHKLLNIRCFNTGMSFNKSFIKFEEWFQDLA